MSQRETDLVAPNGASKVELGETINLFIRARSFSGRPLKGVTLTTPESVLQTDSNGLAWTSIPMPRQLFATAVYDAADQNGKVAVLETMTRRREALRTFDTPLGLVDKADPRFKAVWVTIRLNVGYALRNPYGWLNDTLVDKVYRSEEGESGVSRVAKLREIVKLFAPERASLLHDPAATAATKKLAIGALNADIDKLDHPHLVLELLRVFEAHELAKTPIDPWLQYAFLHYTGLRYELIFHASPTDVLTKLREAELAEQHPDKRPRAASTPAASVVQQALAQEFIAILDAYPDFRPRLDPSLGTPEPWEAAWTTSVKALRAVASELTQKWLAMGDTSSVQSEQGGASHVVFGKEADALGEIVDRRHNPITGGATAISDALWQSAIASTRLVNDFADQVTSFTAPIVGLTNKWSKQPSGIPIGTGAWCNEITYLLEQSRGAKCPTGIPGVVSELQRLTKDPSDGLGFLSPDKATDLQPGDVVIFASWLEDGDKRIPTFLIDPILGPRIHPNPNETTDTTPPPSLVRDTEAYGAKYADWTKACEEIKARNKGKPKQQWEKKPKEPTAPKPSAGFRSTHSSGKPAFSRYRAGTDGTVKQQWLTYVHIAVVVRAQPGEAAANKDIAQSVSGDVLFFETATPMGLNARNLASMKGSYWTCMFGRLSASGVSPPFVHWAIERSVLRKLLEQKGAVP